MTNRAASNATCTTANPVGTSAPFEAIAATRGVPCRYLSMKLENIPDLLRLDFFSRSACEPFRSIVLAKLFKSL